jgi:Holliday junction resolvase RusA-like endonuclease
VLDAVQVAVKTPGSLLVDDSQVVKIVAEKRWATEEPGAEVEVVPLEMEQKELIS